jgi:ATP-dependent Clp protease ATP-binding subunit ClpA
MYRANEPVELTGNAKRALEYAEQEAEVSGETCVSVVHLLLGLIRQRTGLAARTLAAYGVEEKACRTARSAVELTR